MKKRIIGLFLAVIMACSAVPTVFAASLDATKAADALNALGLFGGTGTDAKGKPIYDLDRAPTRQEAITMLVRLLGKEKEATAGTWQTPFTDVEKWAKPYVGYAYTNKLTDGTGTATFGGSSAVTAAQYITFALRALGYKSGTDFQWDKAWELSDKIGLTDGRYNGDSKDFLRGDVAIISHNALSITLKNSKAMLRDTLDLKKPVPAEKEITYGNYPWGEDSGWSHFYKKDGQLYGLDNVGSVGVCFYKYIVDGVEGDYIDADMGAASLLAVICGQAPFQKSDNPSLAWEKDPNGGIMYDYIGEYWDAVSETAPISRKKTEKTVDDSNPLAPKTIETQLVRHSVNGKHLTIDVTSKRVDFYERSTAFDVDGVTCIRHDNSGGVPLINAQELLSYFGIKGTLRLVKDSYGNIIYSFD